MSKKTIFEKIGVEVDLVTRDQVAEIEMNFLEPGALVTMWIAGADEAGGIDLHRRWKRDEKIPN